MTIFFLLQKGFRPLRLLSLLLAAAWLVETSPLLAQSSPADDSVSVMRKEIESFSTDANALERRYAPDDSMASERRREQLYAERLERLDKIDFDRLSAAGQIDFVLLRAHLRRLQKELERERAEAASARALIPFVDAVDQFEETRRRGGDPESAIHAKKLAEMQSQLLDTRHRLEKLSKTNSDAPSKVVARRAIERGRESRSALRAWNEFYSGYDPIFTWWIREPYRQFDKTLDEYLAYLRKDWMGATNETDDPIVGDPIGRPALLDALAAEMIPYTPEELIEIANREFAWCESEQRRAAQDLHFDGDWKKALDHVANTFVPPGEQPRLIQRLSDESVQFLKKHDLVTIPDLCQEVWRMEMMSPERQKVTPYFTGGEVISISYPNESMANEEKLMILRGNNQHFCRATVHHELIPGHHLQGFMSQRYQTHRKLFSTPFLVEGWSLYWEMRLWDLGFPGDPVDGRPASAEDRVGMLFWRSHRCARIIFSLKFHLGQMTPAEAIDFLVDRVGHERRNATAEVRRSVQGGYGPLYQAAYMLGGLQLRALRHELVDSRKMGERAFHDAVLRENAIPIEMIRASLAGQKLTKDYSPRWRFYPLP